MDVCEAPAHRLVPIFSVSIAQFATLHHCDICGRTKCCNACNDGDDDDVDDDDDDDDDDHDLPLTVTRGGVSGMTCSCEAIFAFLTSYAFLTASQLRFALTY